MNDSIDVTSVMIVDYHQQKLGERESEFFFRLLITTIIFIIIIMKFLCCGLQLMY